MKVYFDTNIIDAVFTLVKWDKDEHDKRYADSMKFDIEKNLIALRYLLEIGEEQWGMILGTSSLAQKEIVRIKAKKAPSYYAEKVPELYNILETLMLISFQEVEKDKRVNRLEHTEESMLRQEISKHVSDPEDVDHLIEFKNAGWDVFLTLDWQHLLRPETIRNLDQLGIRVCTPLSLLESFIDLDTLIRTLHGSWETKPVTSKPKSQT